MSILTILSHLFMAAVGVAAGGYVGYRYGANIVKDVQAVKNVSGSAPPK